jgi:VWFA-related protein
MIVWSMRSAVDAIRFPTYFGRSAAGIGGVAVLVLLSASSGVAQEVREQVHVEAIELRVSATEKSGAPVRDLSARDLRLVVDGVDTPIDSLELVALRPAATGEARIEPATEEPEKDAIDRRPEAWAIVVDESTVSIPLRKEAIGQILKFLDAAGAGANRTFFVGSFRLNSLRLDLPWTSELDEVRATLKRLRDHPTVETSSRGVVTSRMPELEFLMIRRRFLATLMQVLAAFPDGSGIRRLVLVTGGKTLASTLDLHGELVDIRETAGALGRPGDEFGDGFDLWTRAVSGPPAEASNADLLAKANERDVAIVAIATGAPDGSGYVDVASKASTNPAPGASPVLSDQLSANQALWRLSRDTGAGPVVLAGRAAAGLASLDAGAIYRLSFHSDGLRGRFHRVELVSARPGVALEYRRAFRVRTAEEEILDVTVANVLSPVRANELSLSAGLESAPSRDHELLNLRFIPPVPERHAPAGAREVHVVAVGRGADGSWTLPIRWAGEAHPDAEGAFRVSIPLRGAGQSRTWSVGLRDVSTSLDGYARVEPAR